MRNIILFTVIICRFSCEEKKPEFVQSKAIKNLFLLKNPPAEDSLVKKEIRLFLLKNPHFYDKREDYDARFYEYTWGTSYFLDNEEDDGGPTSIHFLDRYDDSEISSFSISRCENDTTKLVGKLRFYNKYGDSYKPDTIIGKCK